MVAQINRLISKLKKNLALVLLECLVFFPLVCRAEPSLLTDDESEALLYHIVEPIFKAANISFDENHVHLLSDMSLNAFVADGNHLFVHAGTLIAAENVNEISGILAHEAGHIAGGHIMRQKLKINDLQKLSAVSLIAAGAAAIASQNANAAIAIALGSQGSLLNSMIAYQLTEERSADESAVKYLKMTGQSPIGLYHFMKTIQKENRLSGVHETPYFRTHPISAEREAFFEKSARMNGGKTTSESDQDFKFVKAKLAAFLLDLSRAKQKYPLSLQTDEAKYAHAIFNLRQKKFNLALEDINLLVAKYPQNPYFEQLRGQILFESGQIQKALESAKKSLKMNPKLTESLLLCAQSILEMKNHQKDLQTAIDALNKLQILKENAKAWELLSKAYYEQGKKAESYYALARYNLFIGDIKAAQKQIERALKENPSKALKLKLSDLENLPELKEDEK